MNNLVVTRIVLSAAVLVASIAFFGADGPATAPATSPAPTTREINPKLLELMRAAEAARATQPAAEPAPITDFSDSRSSFRSSSRDSSRDSSRRSSSSFASAASATPATLPSGAVNPDILLRKSIFSKDRRTMLVRPERPPTEVVAAPRAPAIPVLIGTIREDNGFVAYLEDPDSGKIWPFIIGDPLPSDAGTVKDVTLDHMDIAKGDEPVKTIPIGRNLNGDMPGTPSYTATSTTSATTPDTATTATTTTAPTGGATTTSAPVDTSNMTLEEKMKLRAKQQRGGQ